VNAPDAPPDHLKAVKKTRPAAGAAPVVAALAQNARRNFERWILVCAPPRATKFRPTVPAVAATAVTLIAVIASMFFFDTAASAWAVALPQWFRNAFEIITDFGRSGWFLFPFGFVLLCLAALISPQLPHRTQGVLAALAARFGFLFLAIGVPGLFVTIVKRLIGRARPYVGVYDDPFAYLPFIWRSDYASMPSGHATTSVAAAIAIGAIWPRARWIIWLYALVIMFSRVVVLAHHVSDVIAGVIVGAAGAYLVRRWFAARRLVFFGDGLRVSPGPSLQRIKAAFRAAIAAL
jgi:membrane-associated phospholipid phosphatase